MKKLFHFETPRARYKCDAAVVWCFDNRFELAFRKFLQRNELLNVDPIKVAGGAKSLASPATECDRDFILEQIRTSVRLHETRKAILMLHSDCGAYGGLASFGEDAAAEALHHRDELKRAAEVLRSAMPELEIVCYFVDFEGVWDPEVLD